MVKFKLFFRNPALTGLYTCSDKLHWIRQYFVMNLQKKPTSANLIKMNTENLNGNKVAYKFFVLGVSSYLCPENIFKIRKIQGSWPSDILVIVEEALQEKETLLLEKIMSALSVSRFAILEIKDLSCASWILNRLLKEKPAKKFLIFSEKLIPPAENSLFLKTFPLKHFTQKESVDVATKKKELWENLQLWLNKT